jgi:hypothetical protein
LRAFVLSSHQRVSEGEFSALVDKRLTCPMGCGTNGAGYNI